MQEVNSEDKTLHTPDEINLAKTEALDRFFADESEEWMGTWDFNFISSIKDWQNKKNLKLSKKQAYRLDQIYAELEEGGKLPNGSKYDYKNYLR